MGMSFGAQRVCRGLFVLKLFQCHRSERSSVADSPLRKLDDLPGNETRRDRQLYVGDRTQVWRHGHTGFLWATYGTDGGTTGAVRASLLCAPSGPPANAPGPPLGIANGRDAGTCRGGGPLGGLLCGLMSPMMMTSAYFEADSLAAAANGKLHVVEVKSFPLTDGRCDEEKLGAACDQAAWYALLCRQELIEEGLPPDIVSSEAFIIVARGIGLTPTLLRQNLEARIRRAERLLASTPNPGDILAWLPKGVQFPAPALEPEAKLEALENLLDTIGTNYRPSCLQDCGMSRLCRSRAHESDLPKACGSKVVRQLAGVPTLERVIQLARGSPASADEVHVANALARAAGVYDRVMKRGSL
jgi:hypothetical protein